MPDQTIAAVDSLKQEISDFLNSGNYYITPDVTREFDKIQYGLNHLAFDSNIMGTSQEWRTNRSAYGSTVPRIDGEIHNALKDVQSALSGAKVKLEKQHISQLQDNQIREAHHKVMQNLIITGDSISPQTSNAKDRVNQFSDHIGVTDRYTGFRRNITRGSREPFKLDCYWMKQLNNKKVSFDDKGINRGFSAPHPNLYNQYRHQFSSTDSQNPTSQRVPCEVPTQTHRPQTVQPFSNKSIPVKTIQMACGIETTYPGRTEYMTRYKRPMQNETSDFTINPLPDYLMYGRPMAKMVYVPSTTEYQMRYEWPDSKKIIKLPWLRK